MGNVQLPQKPLEPDTAWQAYAHYSLALQFLWEKYIKANGIVMAGSTGTIVVWVQIVLYGLPGKGLVIDNMTFSVISAALAILTLFICGLWRFTTQYMMEKEVFGSPEMSKWYFETSNIPATPWVLNSNMKILGYDVDKLVSTLQVFSPVTCFVCLFGSWVCMLVFIVQNIEALLK